MTSEPAFPQPGTLTANSCMSHPIEYGYGGMSIADYIAVKAMQAMISGKSLSDFRPECIAENSYIIAKAMIAERDRLWQEQKKS